VLRRVNPPATLGGGVIVHAGAAPQPPCAVSSRSLSAPLNAAPLTVQAVSRAALGLEARLRDAGHQPLSLAELGSEASLLASLLADGRVVRVGRAMYAHRDAMDRTRAVVERVILAEGQITVGRLRNELATSRKYSVALLEHLDAARITRRRSDDSRVLRRAPRVVSP
jgi:hypothetical protein